MTGSIRMIVAAIAVAFGGCAASTEPNPKPAPAPVPTVASPYVNPLIVAAAHGAAAIACQFVPAAEREKGKDILGTLLMLLAVDPVAALKTLETEANSTAALKYVWMALQAPTVLSSPTITLAAQWMWNYEPAVNAAVDGCLTALG